MLIQILAFIVLEFNRSDGIQYNRRGHVHIFIVKDITKKINLIAQDKGYKKQQ